MKHKIIAASLASGVAALAFAASDFSKGDGDSFTAKLSMDQSAPDRSGPFGGYSSIVDGVSPSIVSVFTSRDAPQGAGMSPDLGGLFDNPQFREFFGGRVPQMQPQRRGPVPKQEGLGSGVILTKDGYILTNNHVVENADEIRIRLSNGKEHEATIVATDPPSDLAVIKVKGKKLPAATVGDSDKLKQGDLVLAIGSPFGLTHTVTHGIVSATGRDGLNITGYEDFIQTDASINPGNSGGALIDNKGRVIGINTAILSRSGGNVGIGFAIPINMAVKIAGQLIEHGEIKRGYLGVSLEPLSEELADALGVKGSGVVVNEVMPDTPAAEAKFEAGDVITAVNDEAIEDAADVRRFVSREAPGTALEFTVLRGKKQLKLTATIAELPGDLLAGGSSGSKVPSGVPGDGSLAGVRLGKLDDSYRQRLGFEDDVQGVIVLDVDPSSKAAAAGLKPGQVITEVNREAVSTPREAYAKADSREQQATLLRVLDGKRKRFLAIG